MLHHCFSRIFLKNIRSSTLIIMARSGSMIGGCVGLTTGFVLGLYNYGSIGGALGAMGGALSGAHLGRILGNCAEEADLGQKGQIVAGLLAGGAGGVVGHALGLIGTKLVNDKPQEMLNIMKYLLPTTNLKL